MKFMEIFEKCVKYVKEYTNPGKYILTPRAFSDEGIWSFNNYILFILGNKGKSSVLEIENFVENYFDDNEDKLISKQAVSKQRMKIDSSIFKDMNDEFIELFVKSEDYEAFYKNYHVLVVDGSKSEIPNTPESREWANIKDDSLTVIKPSRVLFSTIIDAKTGIVLDFIMENPIPNEREMLKEHIENLKDKVDFKLKQRKFSKHYLSTSKLSKVAISLKLNQYDFENIVFVSEHYQILNEIIKKYSNLDVEFQPCDIDNIWINNELYLEIELDTKT